MNKKTDVLQVVLCAAAALCAVILAVSLLLSHRSASRELKNLTAQFDETTASWKAINEEKLEVKDTLRDLENRISDAEDAISSAQKREKDIARLKEDIASLEEQIAAFGQQ